MQSCGPPGIEFETTFVRPSSNFETQIKIFLIKSESFLNEYFLCIKDTKILTLFNDFFSSVSLYNVIHTMHA